MASLLAKMVVSNRSLSVCRPVITSSRFFNTKLLRDNKDSEDSIPTFIRTCPPFLSDLITNAHQPHLSATRNLTRQLNLMDDQIGIQHNILGNITRWSVDDNNGVGLYLICDMDRVYERDENDSVPTRDLESLLHLTHFDTPCQNWVVMKEAKELNQFVESMRGMHTISFVRVFCTMRYTPTIYIVVGHEGPDLWDPCGGYIAKICLPRKFYRVEDVYAVMSYKSLKIVIPKKDTEKRVYKIERTFLFFRERKGK